ncbi:TY-Chap domain-containing protein [Methylobacterium sp. M6A4_1b]
MLGLGLIPISDAASDDRGRAAFIELHRCAVVARLSSIHLRGPRSTSRDRFLAVSVVRTDQRYVQCIFVDEDRKLHCEASSGAYAQGAEAPGHSLSESSKSALHRLGFAQAGSNENYKREITLGTPPDFDIAADLMIGALHDAYEARASTPLAFFAPRAVLSRGACPGPVS